MIWEETSRSALHLARCVQDNITRAAIDIAAFSPATLACFSVIFHLLPIGLEEAKRCPQQAVLFWMECGWKEKRNWKTAVKLKNARGGGWKGRELPRGLQFPESRAWVSRVIFNITEHSDALKTTTDETSLLQVGVCFINQSGSKTSLLLDRGTPWKTSCDGFFFVKEKEKLVCFVKESLGNLRALKGPARMSNFFHLLVSDSSPQYMWAHGTYSFVGFRNSRGLLWFSLISCWELSPSENIHISWWLLSLTSTAAASPLASVYSTSLTLTCHLCAPLEKRRLRGDVSSHT